MTARLRRAGGQRLLTGFSVSHNLLDLSKCAFGAPEVRSQLIVLTGEPEPVVREMVRFGKLFDGKAKIPQGRSRTALFVEKVKSDRPSRLVAAMLPAEFVDSTFEASIQTEVIAVERENLIIGYGAVEPSR